MTLRLPNLYPTIRTDRAGIILDDIITVQMLLSNLNLQRNAGMNPKPRPQVSLLPVAAHKGSLIVSALFVDLKAQGLYSGVGSDAPDLQLCRASSHK